MASQGKKFHFFAGFSLVSLVSLVWRAEEIKGSGTFWSTTGQMAPLPFHPFPDLPTYKVDNYQFRYDDTMLDYKAVREESAKQAAQEASVAESNGPQNAGPGGAGR